MELKWSISLALWRLEVRGIVFSHNLCIIPFLLKTHKCLFVKSDCCEFNWWNLCLCFDVMFGYVNLMIIKLLMMNLHAQLYIYIYICILCVFNQKLVKYDIVVDEFMFNWCCCCYEMFLLMIETLGNHNHRDVVWICVVLESFTKMGQMVNCDGMMFWFKFYMDLSVFLCLYTFR